jgi:hypothetical protein
VLEFDDLKEFFVVLDAQSVADICSCCHNSDSI